MPPPIATLSRRSRIQAICPSDRPSMALPGTDNGASGDGPPGPVATSIGTAIDKHQSLARNKSPTSANPGPLGTAAERLAFLSEVAPFRGQVLVPHGTRSSIVTKVVPICHRVLRLSL